MSGKRLSRTWIAQNISEPATPTGRKFVAIHGAVFLDDVLGIEAEARAAGLREAPDGDVARLRRQNHEAAAAEEATWD